MRPASATVDRKSDPRGVYTLEMWKGPRVHGRTGYNFRWCDSAGRSPCSGWTAGTKAEARREAIDSLRELRERAA